MKLIEFNAENCPSAREGKPMLHVSHTTGIFSFNRYAIEELKLKVGIMVVLHQDEKEAENFYLEIVKEKGFPLRNKKGASPAVSFSSIVIARKIGDAFDAAGSCSFNIAIEPTMFEKRKLHGLLLKNKK